MNSITDLRSEPSLGSKVAFTNDTKYFVDGYIGRQSAVKDSELTLESGRNVITTTSWMDHGCHQLNINNVSEISRFFQTVKTFGLHQLTDYLIGHLLRHKQKNLILVQDNDLLYIPDLPIH